MVSGNVEGIRNSVLDRLEKMYDINIGKNYMLNTEIIATLCSVTEQIKREVSVGIDRRGNILSISIGDNSTVEVMAVELKQNKLSGVAVIHTHPSGDSSLSSLDVSALTKQRLDYIAALGVKEGECDNITLGFCTVNDGNINPKVIGPMDMEDAISFDIQDEMSESENLMQKYEEVDEVEERAVLVGIDSKESIEELQELAKACNVKTVCKVIQNKDKIDKAFYVGSGKIEEISYLAQLHKANVVIFDDELSGSQIRNVEDAIGIKIIDRTTLILEIFARRARTKESKIQVELAQLKYRLPRLVGMGTMLSRTGGGIGSKGPGEKKLEIDKRHIRERVYDLNTELRKIKDVRKTQREKRDKENIPKVAIVGYTNAGKSTLRNKICEIYAPKDVNQKEKVYEANMLFATLDTTIRAIELEDSRVITLTDTVGFISKLPHDLVEAFKSTLEEVIYADLLLHVVDASSIHALEQIEVVDTVLGELKAIDKPLILVLNKIDLVDLEKVDAIKKKYSDLEILEISAKEGLNLELLMKRVSEKIPSSLINGNFLIPYTQQSIVAYLHNNGKISDEEYREDGTYLEVVVEKKIYNKYKEFLCK